MGMALGNGRVSLIGNGLVKMGNTDVLMFMGMGELVLVYGWASMGWYNGDIEVSVYIGV